MIVTNRDNCTGCELCKSICPKSAIVMMPDKEGFLYPEISNELCVGCGLCSNNCPSNIENHMSSENKANVYAVKLKNDEDRLKSSSGGMFTAISDYVLKHDGVVYGAVFDENFNVCHQRAQDVQVRNKMRGSKYTQSRIYNAYELVKNDLNAGRYVLFTGTACQCVALKKYLDKTDCSKLFVCDLICEGTPSPLVFKSYLNFISSKLKSDVTEVSFRCKETGWNDRKMYIGTHKGAYSNIWYDDPFYQLFSRNIMLRPSCHKCLYANEWRVGDITIGDFWGIDKVNPEFADDKGVSLVLVNTCKGEKLFDEVKESFTCSKQTMEQAKKRQLNLRQPSPKGCKRDEFWGDFCNRGIEYVLKKYTTYGLWVRVKRTIKKFIAPIFRQQ